MRFIGDVPIFVAHDSADVWARPHLFKLDADGAPDRRRRRAAGLLQRHRAVLGQPALRLGRGCSATASRWWIDADARDAGAGRRGAARPLPRLRRVLGGAGGATTTAENGRWVDGAGTRAASTRSRRALGRNCRSSPRTSADHAPTWSAAREFGFPGMRVLQFAFERRPARCAPARTTTRRNVVVYTGTHDNDTVVGWFAHRSGETCHRGGAARARAMPALSRRRRRRDPLGLHPRRAYVGGRRQHRADARPPRPRLHRAHEHARPRLRQLVLAAPARGARPRSFARGCARARRPTGAGRHPEGGGRRHPGHSRERHRALGGACLPRLARGSETPLRS